MDETEAQAVKLLKHLVNEGWLEPPKSKFWLFPVALTITSLRILSFYAVWNSHIVRKFGARAISGPEALRLFFLLGTVVNTTVTDDVMLKIASEAQRFADDYYTI